jgi:hypothetical protein
MATITTTQLPRIAGLVDRLGPLAGKQRGMQLDAQDWNTLVDVVLGALQIDRAQEETAQTSLEERFALRTHEHLGQVAADWLDPALQGRLGDGGASVSTRTALADMAQKVESLGAEVARLSALVETQRAAIDRGATDAVDRAKTLRDFEGRFAGIENLRTGVTALTAQVQGVTTNVGTLLDLRKSLADAAGKPIDVVAMRQQLTDLSALRDNLKGVDGTLLHLRDVELKQKELADVVGVGGPGGLEGRLSTLSSQIETRISAKVDDKATVLAASLKDAGAATETRLKAQLDDAVNTRVAAQVGTAVTGLRGEIATTVTGLRGEITTAVQTGTEQAVQRSHAEIAGLGVSQQINTAVTGLRAEIATAVKTGTEQAVQRSHVEIAGLETRISPTTGHTSVFVGGGVAGQVVQPGPGKT